MLSYGVVSTNQWQSTFFILFDKWLARFFCMPPYRVVHLLGGTGPTPKLPGWPLKRYLESCRLPCIHPCWLKRKLYIFYRCNTCILRLKGCELSEIYQMIVLAPKEKIRCNIDIISYMCVRIICSIARLKGHLLRSAITGISINGKLASQPTFILYKDTLVSFFFCEISFCIV